MEADASGVQTHNRLNTRRQRGRKRIIITLAQLVVGVVFLLLWELAVDARLIPEFFVSKPSLIWSALVTYVSGPDLIKDSSATMLETLAGFGVGTVTGVMAGLALGRFATLRAIANPYLTALNALPRVALAPMFILWFGIGLSSKIYLAVSIVFFIVMIATEAGVRTVDPDFIMMGRAMGSGETQMFAKVIVPAAVPGIFGGLRLGAVYALLAAVFGEMLSAQQGWGQKISLYSQSFEPAGVFAVLCVVVIFAVAFNGIMALVEKRLLSWQT